MILVFVYGSLKRGFSNHSHLSGSVYLGDFSTAAVYTMYDYGDYPAVVQHGTTSIVGEVYQISHEVLTALDELEDYPLFYDRIRIATDFGLAWVYVVRKVVPGAIVVDGGVWTFTCHR